MEKCCISGVRWFFNSCRDVEKGFSLALYFKNIIKIDIFYCKCVKIAKIKEAIILFGL